MKKLFLPIFLGVLVLITSLKANAQNVIVSEDFAKFTEGSIENPSPKDVADEYTTYIPAELMQKEGWTGAAIHQAGGCCFVSNYTSEWDIEDGYLNTPLGDYSGKITIKFRARSQKKYDTSAHIYVNVAFRSETLGGTILSYQTNGRPIPPPSILRPTTNRNKPLFNSRQRKRSSFLSMILRSRGKKRSSPTPKWMGMKV